jgi:TP53 regulating kinase-like protein
MDKEIIARGAEAVLYLDKHKDEDGKARQVLVKDRIRKGYRLPELDKRIRRQRTRHEDSLLDRASRAGVDTPRVFETGENRLVMEFIDGDRVKDSFNDMDADSREEAAVLIGEALGKLHSANIVHGDFTTSNMILKPVDGRKRLFVIDLGLGKYSQKVEDQAVDLYLLYEALKAAHFKYLNEAWQKILKSYGETYTNAQDVLKRLEKIERRRRYKHG